MITRKDTFFTHVFALDLRPFSDNVLFQLISGNMKTILQKLQDFTDKLRWHGSVLTEVINFVSNQLCVLYYFLIIRFIVSAYKTVFFKLRRCGSKHIADKSLKANISLSVDQLISQNMISYDMPKSNKEQLRYLLESKSL